MSLSMESVYLFCAVAGGTVLVLQTTMLLFGGGDHGDGAGGHADHVDIGQADSGEGTTHDTALGLLSVRTVAAFLAFFGLAGWGGARSGWSSGLTMAAAFTAGLMMLFLAAWLLSMQRRLYSQGNLEPQRAVGLTARVYLRIPGANAGKGKITVALQGRTAEFSASTSGAELATGSEVRIVRQITQDTFEVEPLKSGSNS